ncbi:MAG: hypothetical protein ACLP81_07560 [Acidimicrobiales bacterium]
MAAPLFATLILSGLLAGCAGSGDGAASLVPWIDRSAAPSLPRPLSTVPPATDAPACRPGDASVPAHGEVRFEMTLDPGRHRPGQDADLVELHPPR